MIREEELNACGGKLIGRPDVVRDREVIDYKSGAIVELDAATETEVVKAGYARQLRIYGYLVKERLGWWPSRGLLLPLIGPGVELVLEPLRCEEEALEAVALLDAYNAKVAARAGVETFASPSPDSCKWCPFKLICEPLWQSVSPEWSGRLDGAVIEGMATAVPRAIHGGAAFALSIDVQRGSEVVGRIDIAPLQPGVHPAVDSIRAGDPVRVVGLRGRPDGSIVPSQRTVVARVRDLPSIDVANQ